MGIGNGEWVMSNSLPALKGFLILKIPMLTIRNQLMTQRKPAKSCLVVG